MATGGSEAWTHPRPQHGQDSQISRTVTQMLWVYSEICSAAAMAGGCCTHVSTTAAWSTQHPGCVAYASLSAPPCCGRSVTVAAQARECACWSCIVVVVRPAALRTSGAWVVWLTSVINPEQRPMGSRALSLQQLHAAVSCGASAFAHVNIQNH
jgi:hypothetical protein